MHRLTFVLVLAPAALLSCREQRLLPYSGFLDARRSAVAATVSGQVQSIPVREGDRVQKDQLLARLDSRERQAAVALAEANLERDRQALGDAEASLGAPLPTVSFAGTDTAPMPARTHFGQTASNARAALRVGEAALELARTQLAQAEIHAPFEGRVVDRDLGEGEWVSPGTAVVTVEDVKSLSVRLDLDEAQLADLRTGDPTSIRVLAVPGRTFRGHVVEVGPVRAGAAGRDGKRGRPVTGAFRVRVGVDERDEALRPGMTAEVDFDAAFDPETPDPLGSH